MSIGENDKKTARRKGVVAAAVAGGAVALVVAGSPVLGLVALVPAGYLVKDWWDFRAKRGMRF